MSLGVLYQQGAATRLISSVLFFLIFQSLLQQGAGIGHVMYGANSVPYGNIAFLNLVCIVVYCVE